MECAKALIGFRESAAAELMEFVVFSAQVKGTIAMGAVISRVVRLRSCKQDQGWTMANRPHNLAPSAVEGAGLQRGRKHSAELPWWRHYSTDSSITAGFAEASSPVSGAGLQRGRKKKQRRATVAKTLQHE